MSRSPSQQHDPEAGENDHSPDQESLSDQPIHQPDQQTSAPDSSHAQPPAEDQAQPGDPTDGGMQGGAVPQEPTYESEVKEQDRWLPIANVARIMKTALPDNAKIAKEAKECMQECVSEFISFITSEASEKCQVEKRKTVNGEDILFAMFSLGFENYSEALKIYLARYRESNMARNDQGRPTSGHEMGAVPGEAGLGDVTGGAPLGSRPGDLDDQPTQAFGYSV